MKPLAVPASSLAPASRIRRAALSSCAALAPLAMSLLLASAAHAQVSITSLDSAVTENFDGMGSSATATLPAGFKGSSVGSANQIDWATGTTATTQAYGTTGTGAVTSSSGGANVNWANGVTASSTDRALGFLNSGSFTSPKSITFAFTNDTGATITDLDIAFDYEKYRSGTRAWAWSFFHGGTSAPATAAADGDQSYPADANNTTVSTPPLSVSKTVALGGLSIAPGSTYYLRWTLTGNGGSSNGQGLAIDNFAITAHGAAPAGPELSIQPSLSQNEGNIGDACPTAFNFTVSASAPVSGDLNFGFHTTDGTATAGSDYSAVVAGTGTILDGQTTGTATVNVSCDDEFEDDENFTVTLDGGAGYTVAAAAGTSVATILNDDSAPATPTISINSPSVLEGGNGTTATLAFQVHLSSVSGSDVSFDIATTGGTATAGADYVAKSLTSQSIPAGNQDYAFNVTVNGDDLVESDETVIVSVTSISGATPASLTGTGTILNDDVAPPTITPIHAVQGSVVGTTPGSINGCGSGNDSSPMCGQTVTVEAVVTATFPALSAGQLGGFNVQEEAVDADNDDSTSEGVFIYCPSCTGIKEGDRVRVTGTVVEYFGLTEISALPAGVIVTEGTTNHLSEVAPAHITLPIPAGTDINAYYEAREGMLVQFDDDLTVSEYFQLFRYGQVVLVAGDRPRTFTEDNAPSVSGLAAHLDGVARRQVILDDDRDGDEAPLSQASGQQAVYWPHANGGFSLGTQGQDFFRGGDKVHNLVGILQWSRPSSLQSPASTWRVRPSNSYPVTFTPVNLRPQTPPDVGGSIRVVGMNLLNYFTTIDTTSSSSSGPCGPGHTLDCRGADSQAELDRQTARAAKVICDLSPDVAGFMELENNNTPSPTTTITTLLNAVNQRCGGAHQYTFQNNAAGTLGTDAIRVMIVYRSGVVAPAGAAMVDTDSIHSRPPMAQTFDVVDTTNYAFGKRFTVVANHLKSKGSCPTDGSADTDQNDGQACWAEKRRLQALRTAAWVSGTVVPAAGSDNVLLLGDFNSYASETSVQALEAAGYHDLETELHGTNAYSYLFDGEIGHLDYAFANAAMRTYVSGADAWHINADEADLFDYNDDIKDTGEPAYDEKPDGSALTPARTLWDANLAIRASDHDPVLVGLFPVVPQGQLTITPTALAFGDQAVGTTSAPQSVTLANTGNAALSVTVDAAADPFAIAGSSTCGTTSPITIAVGASCTLAYTFTPSVTSTETQTLTVTANGPGSGSIALSGTGTQGHLSITPSTADFGDQAIFSASAPQTVTLKNDGSASLNVTALDAAASPFVRSAGGTCATTLPITLAAGQSCTLLYSFMPTTTGQAVQLLAVTVDALGSGSFLLLGNGVQGHLAITPASVDFGNQTTGTTSAAQTVTITNDGSAPLSVNSLTAATAPFARIAGGCAATPFTLAVNANCTLTYTFTPTSTGAASQNLTVTANAPGNGTIVLSGNGTLPPTADVAVTLAHNADYVQYGDTVNYVITVQNPPGSASATVEVLDMLPGGLINATWTCTPTGAATCVGGSGDMLGDTASLPAGTQVQYVYSATVQSGAPEVLANAVSAAVTNVTDPNTANNTAGDTIRVVIFRDGFDDGATTLALAPYADGRGFASVALAVERSLLDAVGIMPVAIASGRTDDGRTVFTLELARFGANHFLRLTTVDASGRVGRGEWQAASFEQPLDFAWQSATSARNDGYLRIVAGSAELQSMGDDSHRLIELRIPAGADATPWLSAQPQ